MEEQTVGLCVSCTHFGHHSEEGKFCFLFYCPAPVRGTCCDEYMPEEDDSRSVAAPKGNECPLHPGELCPGYVKCTHVEYLPEENQTFCECM